MDSLGLFDYTVKAYGTKKENYCPMGNISLLYNLPLGKRIFTLGTIFITYLTIKKNYSLVDTVLYYILS
jgi:hypothetical protein